MAGRIRWQVGGGGEDGRRRNFKMVRSWSSGRTWQGAREGMEEPEERGGNVGGKEQGKARGGGFGEEEPQGEEGGVERGTERREKVWTRMGWNAGRKGGRRRGECAKEEKMAGRRRWQVGEGKRREEWFLDLRQCCTRGGEKQNPLPKLSATGDKTTNVCLFPKRPRSITTTRTVVAPCRAANTGMGLCATGKTGNTIQIERPGKRQCPNAEGEQSRERDDVQDMSENFVVKETLYDSVAQELHDNDTEEEEPSDDDDEEGESSDDDDEEKETSEDADSEDTDSEDEKGKNESGIDVDIFKKSLFGDLLGEAKQTIAQEVRRGLYSKSSTREKPPYKLGKRDKNVRVYNKKANYHVNMKNVEQVLKEDCCKANCYKKFTVVDVLYKLEEFWAMKEPEQLNFFLAETRVASYFSDEGDLEVLRVTFNDVKVCTKVWRKLYGCSTTRVAKIRKEFREGMVLYEPANKGSVGLSASSQQILTWLHEYIRYNTESMPNSDQFHFSDTLRRRDVYDFFKRDCKELYTNKTLPSRSRFMTIWRVQCPKVLIPALKRFSVCSTCLKFKTDRSQATSAFEREMFGKALAKHRLMQAEERQKLSEHRHKASNHSSEYVVRIIDGMDQSNTILPHFTRVPKDSKLKEGNFVKVHVVGAKVLGLLSNASATVFFDNFKSNSNCMLTVLHRQLLVPFPRVLYLTLYNTSKENKNKFVLSYRVFFVKMRVFSKVKLNFRLVGHTHEDIDQMFSCFSRKLAAHGAFDLPELQYVIRESYKVEQDHGVHVEEMTETMD
ncbi:hypothetical protein CBR_g2668 [Chara braunii]|uniref:DUF7869 domain-containing protein n=1 Tax=Chara braunii TaxID=69332 RepID=A0A388KDM6_CHABU|nr:hypothetical protein CBR_g2668 [Chara braunii]|eukprot:GBG68117.1 hypothetical protein CBR_g2668 [Chara braunii]